MINVTRITRVDNMLNENDDDDDNGRIYVEIPTFEETYYKDVIGMMNMFIKNL